MLNLINLINSLLNLSLVLLIGVPIACFLIYIFSGILSSFIGGPIWLWFIIILILSIPTCKQGIDKAKLKNETTNES